MPRHRIDDFVACVTIWTPHPGSVLLPALCRNLPLLNIHLFPFLGQHKYCYNKHWSFINLCFMDCFRRRPRYWFIHGLLKVFLRDWELSTLEIIARHKGRTEEQSWGPRVLSFFLYTCGSGDKTGATLSSWRSVKMWNVNFCFVGLWPLMCWCFFGRWEAGGEGSLSPCGGLGAAPLVSEGLQSPFPPQPLTLGAPPEGVAASPTPVGYALRASAAVINKPATHRL